MCADLEDMLSAVDDFRQFLGPELRTVMGSASVIEEVSVMVSVSRLGGGGGWNAREGSELTWASPQAGTPASAVTVNLHVSGSRSSSTSVHYRGNVRKPLPGLSVFHHHTLARSCSGHGGARGSCGLQPL